MSSDNPDTADSVDRSGAGSVLLPGFIDRSFLAKFVLSLLLVSLMIGGVSAYTYVETSDQLSEEAKTEYVGLADQSVTQIVDWREARSDTTRMLSQFEVVQSNDPDRIQDFLQSESNRLPADVYRVHYVNLDTSTIVASTNRAKQGETLNTREASWQTQDIEYGPSGVFVSDAEEVHLRSLVSFVSPVETDSGDKMALVMQTNLDAVASDLRTPDDSVFTQVVDSKGRIVAGTQESSDLDRNDGTLEEYSPAGTDADVIQQGMDGGSGFLERSDKELEEDHVVTYSSVPGTDWVVATHSPESYAFSLRSTITNSLLVLIATSLVGLGMIAVAFGRGTTATLGRLTEKAEALESGDLDVDLSVERADEFGRLTAAFASMRNSLTDRIEDAERARKEAEVSRAEAAELNEYLQDKADEYAQIMQRCAAGDITQRMETDGESDAMDRIAEEFNEMIEELEKTTGQLKSFSEEVETAGRDVQRSAEIVRETSEQAVDAATSVADESGDEADRLREISETITGITTDLKAIDNQHENVEFGDALDRIESVGALLDEGLTRTDGVITTAEDAAAAAEEQAAELNEVSERAGDLVRYAGPLQEVLDRFETDSEREFYFPTGPGGDEVQTAGQD